MTYAASASTFDQTRPPSDAGEASPLPAGLSLHQVSRRFDSAVALDDVAVSLPEGRFSVLLGPSGCGKSTLLRLIAGLDTPTSGVIRLAGRDITRLPPAERDLSMVFQSYALFPHLNVAENILFGLSVRRVRKAEQRQRLERVARMMGLWELLDRRPSQLSGGQQQRVALARAVISERPVCLMDEPLSNLDAKLRAEMRVEIRALQKRLGLTMVYVTHDQVEAMTMADHIVVLDKGRVQQVATPRELYAAPANTFCARFIGTPPMNLIPAHALAGQRALPEGSMLGIRPEDIAIGANGVPARLADIEYLGADQLATFEIGPETAPTRLHARLPAREALGDTGLHLRWHTEAEHLFGADGQRITSFTQ
ncbi:MAG: sn-glycerol 3-phosphate transport system ATP-binding protein [Saliniramus fredricksonii]|uniref:Carbohydrate ABC transporter ATP-binding protein, CUT1 family n=1 Tax=Saliniramus fredricksonii TaxID=1653334 RepID=A0A0P7YCE2_9HYPH|nr:ABC transporter ATP-binding protein [Saliniramus fredricksonii]KPQ11756.1 MAG: sn-glycerol 3-phosphate transport system ATP-binding protein [Saliniramus fredricksonii]SCC82318.1 carbohydrate ABC transporter ATP-binding protein, CUT1 family [Saliniramus fredricksonii]